MTERKPSYEDLELRLREAEQIIETIKNGQADAIVSKGRFKLLRIRETERALRASEHRYRRLFEAMTEGFALHELIFDKHGNILASKFIEVNPAFEKHTGLKAENIIGKLSGDIFTGVEPEWFDKFRELFQTGRPIIFEGKFGLLNRIFNVHAFKVDEYRFATLCSDITDRKRTEDELFASNERLSALLSALPVGVSFSDDITCRSITGNNVLLKQFEIGPDENLSPAAPDNSAIGRKIQYFYNGHEIGISDLPIYRAVAENREISKMEIEILLPGGKKWFADYYGAPIHDREGNVKAGIAVTVDITERKKGEEKIRLLNETLEQRVNERTELAEARARQLRSMAVELIEIEERERRRIAELLHDDLQQVLAAARMQIEVACKRIPSEPLLVNVEHLLKEAIAKSRNLSRILSPAVLRHSGFVPALESLAKQMKDQFGLIVDIEGAEIPEFNNLPLKMFMFRTVQELLFNIVKHAGVKNAKVILSESDENFLITVQDKGRGFNLDILNSLTKSGAFGLLSLQERAGYIGCRLEINSSLENGSNLTLLVPLSLVKEGGLERPAEWRPTSNPAVEHEAEQTAQGVKRVLFVDDHKIIRQGLISLVSSQPDIKIAGEAENGIEAIERAHELRPDVVIMDISMPVMDGIEATRNIKREMPGIRVIGLSMYEDEELKKTMTHAGAETLVSKAASSAELLKAIYGLDDHIGDPVRVA